jgi:hypothetical protein
MAQVLDQLPQQERQQIRAYFSELGRKGGRNRAKKLSPEHRREIAKQGVRAIDKRLVESAATDLTIEQRAWIAAFQRAPSVRGDVRAYIERVWTKKLPKIYESMLAAAMRDEHRPAAFEVLKAMTLLSSLTPRRLQQSVASDMLAPLPSDVDLSHLSDETLHRLLREAPPEGKGPRSEAKPHAGPRHAKKAARPPQAAPSLPPESSIGS